MENGKNDRSSPKAHPRAKLRITIAPQMAIAPQKCFLEQNSQLPTHLKFGSPVFLVSMEMKNWCQPLWKMGKVAIAPQNMSSHSSPKMHPRAKLPITNPPKVWVFGFPVSMEMENWCRPL